MMLGAVPQGCRERLTAHYGCSVVDWLDHVPEMMNESAAAWGLFPEDYHDAGHASVIATATTSAGAPVALKAWYDHDRFEHETAALKHWQPLNGQVIRSQRDDSALACLELIGGVPAGAPRPNDGDERVATALAAMHRHQAPDHRFPRLDTYVASEIQPRIQKRAAQFGSIAPPYLVDLGLKALNSRRSTGTEVLLHADLYSENVLFTREGTAVFIDPLPMVGDAAFDWAFFVVYHDLDQDPVPRLRLASRASGLANSVLMPWCLMLSVDGLLYYHEVGDARESRMIDVITLLAAGGRPA